MAKKLSATFGITYVQHKQMHRMHPLDNSWCFECRYILLTCISQDEIVAKFAKKLQQVPKIPDFTKNNIYIKKFLRST